MNARLSLVAAVLTAAVSAPAQENLELGKMWTFENPPLAYLKDEYGFAPTPEWLDALRLASLRYGGGCSASFVSPKGLIMTNHHCMRDNVAEVQGDNDWLTNGFYATSLDDEVRVPGLTVQQLVDMVDVTARMNDGITAADDDAVIAKKWSTNQARIVAEAKTAQPDLDVQVVKLYQGAIWQLYSYKIYDDIRLVCAPHLQTAHFGGDPDNFTYPRYSIDFGFCRAYENGEPADTAAHYFKWSTRGAKDGELVFVTGNPGTTKRLLTHAQLEYMRDVWHPIVNELIDGRLAVRREIAEKHAELADEMRTEILGLENAQKAYRGYHTGLLDESLMAQKADAERAFVAKVMADANLKSRFGKVWGVLAKVATERAQLEARRRFQSTGGHPVLAIARDLLAGNFDRAKRIAAQPITPLQRADFVDHLTRMQNWLPEDDPYRRAILGNRTPEQVATMLDSSVLTKPDEVEKVIAAGADAIPRMRMLALGMAKAIAPLAEVNAKQDAALTEAEETWGAKLGQALHAVYGTKVSPDATFTLRFSDGLVSGYPFNGTVAPHRTTFYGLYARNLEFGGAYPFDLPQIWLDRQDRVDLSKSVNLVSTNDIIGGNSGSPLVNADLEVVGLVFDGNIEMLPNRYLYRAEIPRSVSVHVDAILEALRTIYDADRVVTELTGSGSGN